MCVCVFHDVFPMKSLELVANLLQLAARINKTCYVEVLSNINKHLYDFTVI